MTQFSESFYIGAGTLSLSGLAVFLYYMRSVLLTSRCSNLSLFWGACKIENKVLDSDDALQAITIDQPPTITTDSGGSRNTLNGSGST